MPVLGDVGSGQVYVERPPDRSLAPIVSSVWVQEISLSGTAYVQRHVPNGAVELQWRSGTPLRVVGPLTAPLLERLSPGSTVVGIRFLPGAAGPALGLPASELVDQAVDVEHVWGSVVGKDIDERLNAAGSPHDALDVLEDEVARHAAASDRPDALVLAAVDKLMPWQTGGVRAVTSELFISEAQFRRRCRAAVGLSPKVLQRTLRFQVFLALVQRAIADGRPPGDDGLAMLAAEAGYADQSHLTRECVRLTGLAPRAFMSATQQTCSCGHDHSASFTSILGSRKGDVA